MAFAISAALAGVAGVLYAHNLSPRRQPPKNFGYNMSIMILVFVVLGGLGNIRGSMIAAIILTMLPELFTRPERLPNADLRSGPDRYDDLQLQSEGHRDEICFHGPYQEKKKNLQRRLHNMAMLEVKKYRHLFWRIKKQWTISVRPSKRTALRPHRTKRRRQDYHFQSADRCLQRQITALFSWMARN